MRPLTTYLPKPMLPLGRKPVLQHIVESIEIKGRDNTGAIISLYRIPKREVASRRVAVPETEEFSKAVRLADIIEKSYPAEQPEGKQWASACRYVLGTRNFNALKNWGRDEEGEIQLTPAIYRLIKQDVPVWGVSLKNQLVR